jgi:hypothetical protein
LKPFTAISVFSIFVKKRRNNLAKIWIHWLLALAFEIEYYIYYWVGQPPRSDHPWSAFHFSLVTSLSIIQFFPGYILVYNRPYSLFTIWCLWTLIGLFKLNQLTFSCYILRFRKKPLANNLILKSKLVSGTCKPSIFILALINFNHKLPLREWKIRFEKKERTCHIKLLANINFFVAQKNADSEPFLFNLGKSTWCEKNVKRILQFCKLFRQLVNSLVFKILNLDLLLASLHKTARELESCYV